MWIYLKEKMFKKKDKRQWIYAFAAFSLPFIFYIGIFFGRSFGLECAAGVMGSSSPYKQTTTVSNSYCLDIADVGAYAWQHYPHPVKVAKEYFKFHFPLWNQNNGAGVPLAANFQSAAYFIPNIIFAAFNNVFAFDFYFVLRMAIASLGMYLFLRTFRLPQILSLIGSLVIFLNGYNTFFPTNIHFNVDILLPWIAYLINKAFFERKLKYFVLLSLVTGLSHLGGMPESSLLIALFFVLYAAFLSLFVAKSKQKIPFAFAFLLSFFVSFLLSAILTLPGYEYIQNGLSSHRPGASQPKSVTYENILFWPFGRLLGLLWETRKSQPFISFGIWYSYVGTFSFYLLISGVLLVLSSLFKRFKSKFDSNLRYYLFFFLFFVLIASQYFGLVKNPLFTLFPGFSQTNFPKYSQSLLYFLTSTIVVFTLYYLIKLKSRLIIFLSVFIIFFLTIGVYFGLKNAAIQAAMFPHFTKQLALSAAIVLVISGLLFFKETFGKKKRVLYFLFFLIAAVELFLYLPRHGDMQRRDSFRKPPAIDFLLSKDYKQTRIFSPDYILYPNLSALFDLNDVRNLDALWPKSYYNYLKYFIVPEMDKTVMRFTGLRDGGATKDAQFVNNVFFDLLSVKYLLSYRNVDNQQFKKIYDKEMKIYENNQFIPRLHPISEIKCSKNEYETAKLMRNSESNMRNLGIVLAQNCKRGTFNTNNINLTNQNFDNQKVSFLYFSPHESYIILSNTFYPGWKLKIEGKEYPIDQVNLAFQGLRLPKGNNLQVEVVYDPLSFKLGLTITLISLGFCVFILISHYRNKKIVN